MPSRVRVVLGDVEWIAEISDGRIRLVGVESPFEVAPAGADHFVIRSPAGELAMSAAGAGRSVWIGCEGHVFETEVQPASRASHTRARDHDLLGPPMPATVVRIVSGPGDTVRAGDVLIALEAMKMELPIRAPRDGVIKAVHCREGELVQPGATLVELE